MAYMPLLLLFGACLQGQSIGVTLCSDYAADGIELLQTNAHATRRAQASAGSEYDAIAAEVMGQLQQEPPEASPANLEAAQDGLARAAEAQDGQERPAAAAATEIAPQSGTAPGGAVGGSHRANASVGYGPGARSAYSLQLHLLPRKFGGEAGTGFQVAKPPDRAMLGAMPPAAELPQQEAADGGEPAPQDDAVQANAVPVPQDDAVQTNAVPVPQDDAVQANLAEQGGYMSQRSGSLVAPRCTPKCSWQCEQSKCDEECAPVCKAPVCETRCTKADLAGCKVDCEQPHCTVLCPKSISMLSKGQACTTHCSEAMCKLNCDDRSQPCYNICEEPSCEWKCTAPSSCPRPQCSMVCEAPSSCSGHATLEQLPPLRPGEVAVQAFKAPANLLQGARNVTQKGNSLLGMASRVTAPRAMISVPVREMAPAVRQGSQPEMRQWQMDIPMQASRWPMERFDS